jgi:tRNA1Val (adenine37-N6)-methyltransferase
MPNSYFQFKQFVIHQDRCAMKVCTDACLLGAWVAEKLAAGSTGLRPGAALESPEPGLRVLDIGSGTGLLMLMLAQKHPGVVHGIELDPPAYVQLKENIAASTWSRSLEAFEGDVRGYVFPSRYDLIISNPPFFEEDLPSASGAENLARHSKELRLAELIRVIGDNLESTGSFGILLPYHRTEYFTGLAAGSGFRLKERVRVRQTPGHDFFRSMLYFSKGKDGDDTKETELIIKNEKGGYTEAFTGLLKDYYLNL